MKYMLLIYGAQPTEPPSEEAVQQEMNGLALLDELAADDRLRGYHLFPAARADLLRRLGRSAEAATAYREALALVGNEPEREYLRRRPAEVEGS